MELLILGIAFLICLIIIISQKNKKNKESSGYAYYNSSPSSKIKNKKSGVKLPHHRVRDGVRMPNICYPDLNMDGIPDKMEELYTCDTEPTETFNGGGGTSGGGGASGSWVDDTSSSYDSGDSDYGD